MIRVLVVDDSAVARDYLSFVLTEDPRICVVGTASNGFEALEAVTRHQPDLVTMDIHMPVMGGIEATRRIMESHPTPVVIVSANLGNQEVESSIEALAAGALAVVLRDSADLVKTVKLMSEIRVVHRTRPDRPAADPSSTGSGLSKGEPLVGAVGASTGGPGALARLLSDLPVLPFPLLVVQHIASGFLPGLVDWLAKATVLPLSIAVHGHLALPGRVYFAPDGLHLGIDGQRRMVLCSAAPDLGLRPSVTHLFRSVRESFGARAVGILLTGMGRDGAEELKALKEAGALTLVQDEESSVVFGMPGEAIRLGGATQVLSPEGMTAVLAGLKTTVTGGNA